MSENSTQSLQVVQAKTQTTSVREKLCKVGLVAGTFAMANVANAAELDFTAATAELTGAQAGIVALIGILLTVTGIVLAWRTFRSGAR